MGLWAFGLAALFYAGAPSIDALAAETSATLDLPPAPYRPLPKGTQVDYDTWSFQVEKSNGFDITLKIDGDRWTHYYAVFGRTGSKAYTIDEEITSTGGEWDATLKGDTKSALEGLWPLQPGRKIRFDATEERSGYKGFPEVRIWTVTLEVTGTAVLDLHGKQYAAFVIRERGITDGRLHNFGVGSPIEYVTTLWFHPGSGLVLKAIREWVVGPREGETDRYKLVRVRFQEGTTNLALNTIADAPPRRTVAKAGPDKKLTGAIGLGLGAPGSQQSNVAPLPIEKQGKEVRRIKRGAEIERLKEEIEIARLKRQLEQERTAKTVTPTVKRKNTAYADIDFGTYHALVIGNNDYKHLPDLQTAVNDARAVADVLANEYGFEVSTLINATRADIIEALDGYRESMTNNDNLLIYYAGHGWLDEDVNRGYWLPVDARRNRRTNWVSNTTISDTLTAVLSKHVMVVADSCYSGTLARGAGVKLRTGDYWRRMARKRTRVALTSGGLEPVADKGGSGHSPFAEAFIKVLKGNAGVIDGTQLFGDVRRRVMINADQTPEYSDVRNAGHDGGDFLFVRKY